jgi:aminoglycoside phosphotransferase family enzyme
MKPGKKHNAKRKSALLAAKVAFLRNPSSYPHRPARVKTVESHMSWVFLAGEHAYKLKKPVRYPFLDFSTLAARQAHCRAELRLNRRLARKVYYGIEPLVMATDGHLHLGGPGEVTDWLVHMRRLPEERMLDRAIRENVLKPRDIRPAAEMLAVFYHAAPAVRVARWRYLDRFAADVEENLRELQNPAFALPVKRVQAIGRAQRHFLEHYGALLEKRLAERRVIEAHGDLRPEHICLGPPPEIIDCLEFNRAFRLLDPAEELSFLSIECEQLGAAWVGETFFRAYRRATGDRPPKPLLAFYMSYRAFLRAKISIWHLKEPQPRTPAKWPRLARSYLGIALTHARIFR